MDTLDADWNRSLSVWWLIVWRGILGGAVLGALAGAVWGLVSALAGVPELAGPGGAVAGFIASLIWGLVVVRMALRKKYRDFRIALLRT